MKTKIFRASSMGEALAKVKCELGPNAVILHTRSIPKKAVLGRQGRSDVEITAADSSFYLPKRSSHARVGRRSEARSTVDGASRMVSTDIDSVPSDALAALSADMVALKGAVAELVG